MEHVFPVTLDDFFFFFYEGNIMLSRQSNFQIMLMHILIISVIFFFTKIVTFADTTYPPTRFAKTHPRLMVFMTAAVLII